MDPVLGVLVEKLVILIENEARHVIEYPEQFKQTKAELLFIQSFLSDIGKVNLKDRKEVLKRVTQKLRELIYDAEDIIADCELMFTQHQRRRQASKRSFGLSLRMLKFRYRMGKELGKINQDIGHLKEDIRSFLVPSLTLPSQDHEVRGSHSVEYPVLINETEIVGIYDDSKKIEGWVFEANSPLTVIGIVGMGGIGKTTLAQRIYDCDSLKNYFGCTFFVTVSQSVDLKEIISNMLRELNVNEDSLRRDTRGLLDQLRIRLNGMKYLLILDDVWGTNAGVGPWWVSLKSAISQGSCGNCVIVTTRHEEVALSMGVIESRIHHPQMLSRDDSWSLFSKHAFSREEGRRCPNPNLEGIGKEIVSKCGGLPLAIKVIGGMMLRKGYSSKEWEQAYEDLKEKLAIQEKDEKVIPILQLSFEELPMHLKPCILYTCMFPEDSLISVKDMILWWIGEGFVQGSTGKTAYEVGEEYFDELRSRCLLRGVHRDEFKTKFVRYRVHDLIREMLIKIAREENFMDLDERGKLSIGMHSRRAGIMNDTKLQDLSDINLKSLRTLVIRDDTEYPQFVENVGIKLCQLRMLRVLDIKLSGAIMSDGIDESWLSEIGSLLHLVHLSIRTNKNFVCPNFIGKLHNLKILRLHCNGLTSLPKEIGCLEKLTILDLTDSYLLKVLPVEIGSLSNLEELNGFSSVCSENIVSGCFMSDLKKLTKLRKLDIRLQQTSDWDLHVLSELKLLKVLKLDFAGLHGKMVGFAFSPLQQLEVLHLRHFPGKITPTWMNPIIFPNLRFLCISSGKFTGFSPEFFGEGKESGVLKLEVIALDNLNVTLNKRSLKKKIPLVRLIQKRRGRLFYGL